jgi:hypothetical protein
MGCTGSKKEKEEVKQPPVQVQDERKDTEHKPVVQRLTEE